MHLLENHQDWQEKDLACIYKKGRKEQNNSLSELKEAIKKDNSRN